MQITSKRHFISSPICASALTLGIWLLSGLSSVGAQQSTQSVQGTGATTASTTADTSGSGDSLTEIIVTAERRSQNLQTTPVAVTAMSGSMLQELSVNTIGGLTNISPSIQADTFQGNVQIHIRGIGVQDIIGGFDSSIAAHIDGVYLARPAALASAMMDVSQVEIVRGPQGTLYGRNATGGSVNFITKDPTNEWTNDSSITVGNYNARNLFSAIGGPISSDDRLTFRLAAQIDDHDGYTTLYRPQLSDSSLGGRPYQSAEDLHDKMARLKILFKPTDNISLLISGDYDRENDAAVVYQFFNDGYRASPLFLQLQSQGDVTPFYSRQEYSAAQAFNRPEYWGTSAKLSIDFPAFTFTSLTAYRHTNMDNYDDISGGSVLLIDQLKTELDRETSQEFQITSHPGSALQYVGGLYYFFEHDDVTQHYFIPYVPALFGLPADPTCCELYLDGTVATQAEAAFGQLTYNFTDALALIAGGRYSIEQRGGGNDVHFDDDPAFTNITRFNQVTYDAFTPKIGLQYQPSANAFLYATASKGFKSGGFNIGSVQNAPFKPETIWSYEAGGKFDFLDKRARLNLAAFIYNYKDLQVQEVRDQNVFITNAANARVKGVELESLTQVTHSVLVDVNLAYLDARFTDFITGNVNLPQLGQLNLSGNHLPQSPEGKAQIGIEKTFDIIGNHGTVKIRGDAAWQDRVYFTVYNEPFVSQPAYWWLKARATYAPPSANWHAAAYIDNIQDKVVIANAQTGADIDGARTFGNLAPPRTFGVRFDYSF
jgi:iron complex outermembrane receptor protein